MQSIIFDNELELNKAHMSLEELKGLVESFSRISMLKSSHKKIKAYKDILKIYNNWTDTAGYVFYT